MTLASTQVMREISQLAGTCTIPHKIAPYLLDGRTLSTQQAEGVLRRLRRCQEDGPCWVKITEPGIYYHNGKAYKVFQSQYGDHRLQAKIFDPGSRSWVHAPGMLGQGRLSATELMTERDSLEFEKLYGFPMCVTCGRPLENDDSRERRRGPVCYGKYVAAGGAA